MCSSQLIRESEHAQKCVLLLNVFTSPINPLKGQLMPFTAFPDKVEDSWMGNCLHVVSCGGTWLLQQ